MRRRLWDRTSEPARAAARARLIGAGMPAGEADAAAITALEKAR